MPKAEAVFSFIKMYMRKEQSSGAVYSYSLAEPGLREGVAPRGTTRADERDIEEWDVSHAK